MSVFAELIRRDITRRAPPPRDLLRNARHIPTWLTPHDPDPYVFGPRYPGSRGEYRGLRYAPGVLLLCHPCDVTWIGWPGDTCWADGCGREGIPL